MKRSEGRVNRGMVGTLLGACLAVGGCALITFGSLKAVPFGLGLLIIGFFLIYYGINYVN